MDSRAILEDAFDRIRGGVDRVTEGLTAEDLAFRPGPDANSIGWLIWHLTRVQDHHVSEIAGIEQAWVESDWPDRLNLDPDPDNTGYAHTSDDVAAVRAGSAELLRAYYQEVHTRTADYLAGVTPEELDRVIDTRWDPPVTVGVRLVSVIGDDMQHIGQAAYVRGILERRR